MRGRAVRLSVKTATDKPEDGQIIQTTTIPPPGAHLWRRADLHPQMPRLH